MTEQLSEACLLDTPLRCAPSARSHGKHEMVDEDGRSRESYSAGSPEAGQRETGHRCGRSAHVLRTLLAGSQGFTTPASQRASPQTLHHLKVYEWTTQSSRKR